jgi:hypothetical protein
LLGADSAAAGSDRERQAFFASALHRHEKLWDAPNAFRSRPLCAGESQDAPSLRLPALQRRPAHFMGFATLEMTAILATLVRQFRFTAVEGYRLELAPDFTTRSKGGLPLIIEKI